jgi:hypothetical protein
MNCKVEWNSEFIREMMPKTFMNNDYKKHRENLLLSLEESLLPETQSYANFQKEMKIEYNELIKLKQLIKDLQYDYYIKYNKYYRKKNNGYKKLDKKEFIMACPTNICRGFLSTQYKCEQCQLSFCKYCHQQKLENHICHEDDVKTVQLLETNTKKCPKCYIPIFKIDGCPQMWCTECHTAFSWTTGNIISGVVHNPHYLEWQRNHNNNENNENTQNCNHQFKFLKSNEQIYINRIEQFITHIREYEIPFLQRNLNINSFDKNRDLRIQYLNNEIDRNHFKSLIQKRNKANEKKKSYEMLWQMFISTSIDILSKLVQSNIYITFLTEMEELRNYVNEQFYRFSKLYSCTQLKISENWHIY